MRIGVDSRPLREKQTSGIPRFVRSVLRALSEIDDENEYVLYAHKDFDFKLPNHRWTKKFGALTRYGSVWMQAELPFWLKRDKVDLFWGTQHILPLMMSGQIRSVLTVHDLIHCVFPGSMKPLNLIINKMIIPPSVKKADVVATDSYWTLLDVKNFINPQKTAMEVVKLAQGRQFWSRDRKESKEKVARIIGSSEPYLLTVGTFEPRKNLVGAFRAYSLIAEKIPHRLLVVGQKGWKNNTVLQEIKNSSVKDKITFAGYVADEFLPFIYSGADLFIFPSLYEGFGLPCLEAMACGVPVIASKVSSIPEVVGDAALLVDPNNHQEIADKIIQVLERPELRRDLVNRGKKQSSDFTWEKTAREMLSIFNRLSAN